MTIEHHDLVHELPEFRDSIHELKMKDAHFARLFDEYHDVTRQVERMEAEIEPVATRTEEEYKLRRLQLKDELYAMLRASRDSSVALPVTKKGSAGADPFFLRPA